MKKTKSSSEKRILTCEDLYNPDYNHWAKMEFWQFNEAILLSLNIIPPAEIVLPPHEETWNLIKSEAKASLGYKRIYSDEDEYEISESYMKDFVKSFCSDEIAHIELLMGRSAEVWTNKFRNKVDPAKFVKWAKRIDLNLPVKMVNAVKKYHPDELNSSAKANTKNETPEPLSGEERAELGRLRREKVKWDKSIRAAVEAALLNKDKKITHAELTDSLHKYKLPDTTLDIIWTALREKGLTKDAGRPPKNPLNVSKVD